MHARTERAAARQGSYAQPDVACVVANIEFETWFVAAAASLTKYLDLSAICKLPDNPEADRLDKAWIEKYFIGEKYSETVDQPKMASAMDLEMCRRNSPSFDKLCRELEARLQP